MMGRNCCSLHFIGEAMLIRLILTLYTASLCDGVVVEGNYEVESNLSLGLVVDVGVVHQFFIKNEIFYILNYFATLNSLLLALSLLLHDNLHLHEQNFVLQKLLLVLIQLLYEICYIEIGLVHLHLLLVFLVNCIDFFEEVTTVRNL